MLGGFRQTRLGQPAAKRHETISACLMRQYSTHPEKTRKSLPAVARLQADRSSRASLRTNPQTPGSSPLPCVGGIACRRRRLPPVRAGGRLILLEIWALSSAPAPHDQSELCWATSYERIRKGRGGTHVARHDMTRPAVPAPECRREPHRRMFNNL